jgi:hypothetical protein
MNRGDPFHFWKKNILKFSPKIQAFMAKTPKYAQKQSFSSFSKKNFFYYKILVAYLQKSYKIEYSF